MQRLKRFGVASCVWLALQATAWATEPPPEEPPPEEPDHSWVDYFVELILGPAEFMWEAVKCGAVTAFCWVVDKVVEAFFLILEGLAEFWPDMGAHADAIADFVHWARLANAWLPLDWGFGLLLGYFGFVLFVITVKWVLKLIPTLG